MYSFLPGFNYTNSYGYDAASNRTSLSAPDGSITTYGYDTLNRLNGLANSWAGSFGFGYDARQGALWHLALDQGQVWQRRFYDFVVWSEGKRVEKLRNPVTRGLVLEPEQWRWSSYRHYA